MKKYATAQWVKFAVTTLLYLLFCVWVQNYWIALPGVLLLADLYLFKYIKWDWWKDSKYAVVRSVMSWVDAIVFALIAVTFIFTFFLQNYQIPSSSLEKTMLVGDFLLVSKFNYGPRVPNTPIAFPLTQHTMPVLDCKSYLEWPNWPYKRIKGLGSVERNDIVVFNFPAGDTVAFRQQNPDYYTLCYLYGRDAVNEKKNLYGDILYRPVDRRENYVKRCIGMPGDDLEIRNNDLYINGAKQKNPAKMQLNYYVQTNGYLLTESDFRMLGVSPDDRMLLNGDANAPQLFAYLGFEQSPDGRFLPAYHMPLTQEAIDKLNRSGWVTKMVVEPDATNSTIYPLSFSNRWSRDNYGPIHIPKRGETLPLTADTYPIYERCIVNYEGNKLEERNGAYYINGELATSYTFKMDYYFMAGDNRHCSADSRMWGFVPEDHIVGQPVLVWVSLDKDRGWFDGKVRFDRIFKWVINE